MKHCKGCNAKFTPKHHLQTHCSVVCQRATKNSVWRWRKGWREKRLALIKERWAALKERRGVS